MPFGYEVEYREKPRGYWLTSGEERIKIPSVTTVLGILDKPALMGWAAKMTREGVVELGKVGELGIDWNRESASNALYMRLKENNLLHTQRRDTAATRGTSVHDALELWATEGKVPNPQDFPTTDRGYVKALTAYLVDHQPHFLQSELMVGSWEHQFAGRLDHIIEVDGEPAILDLKTSKDLYKEVHMQTSGYAIAAAEMQVIPTDAESIRTFAVCARENGTYRHIETQNRPEVFLAVLGAYNAVKSIEQEIKAAEKVAA